MLVVRVYSVWRKRGKLELGRTNRFVCVNVAVTVLLAAVVSFSTDVIL